MATINGADRSEILRTTFGSDVIFGNYALDRHAGGDAVVPQLVTGGGPDPETDPEPFVGSRDSKRVLGPDLSAGADPYIGDEPDPYIGDEPDPDIGDESPSGGSHPGDPERGFVDPEHPEREFQAGIVETGGKGVDFLTGGAQDDVLMGGGGDDNVFGDGGDDNVWGEDGDDIVLGGGGDDKVIGGEGADWLLGGAETISSWAVWTKTRSNS
ncbi:calcium-binding protein [Mesorhizobium sp. ORM16]|uniref:calcium-binding protein n=1 Tax=Mesorhizobium sp. ORM16 TaxID=3376989 RepID=UPI0038574B9C